MRSVRAGPEAQGWVLYDAECGFCVKSVRRFGGVVRRRGFRAVPMQEGWVQGWLERVGMPQPEEMIVLLPDGSWMGGADALLYLVRRVWWAWPIWAVGRVWPMRGIFRRVYRWLATHRYCVAGRCALPRSGGTGQEERGP